MQHYSVLLFTKNNNNGGGRYDKKIEVTSRVPLKSVVRPTLWNRMYDGLLGIESPPQTASFGFADDIAIVITAKDETTMMEKANVPMQQVLDCLQL